MFFHRGRQQADCDAGTRAQSAFSNNIITSVLTVAGSLTPHWKLHSKTCRNRMSSAFKYQLWIQHLQPHTLISLPPGSHWFLWGKTEKKSTCTTVRVKVMVLSDDYHWLQRLFYRLHIISSAKNVQKLIKQIISSQRWTKKAANRFFRDKEIFKYGRFLVFVKRKAAVDYQLCFVTIKQVLIVKTKRKNQHKRRAKEMFNKSTENLINDPTFGQNSWFGCNR